MQPLSFSTSTLSLVQMCQQMVGSRLSLRLSVQKRSHPGVRVVQAALQYETAVKVIEGSVCKLLVPLAEVRKGLLFTELLSRLLFLFARHHLF